jgi:hypothetical protein
MPSSQLRSKRMNHERMDCRNEVPAESATRMASSTSAGVTMIGSLWMVSPAAVARLATPSRSSWLGLPMPMSANVPAGRPAFSRSSIHRSAVNKVTAPTPARATRPVALHVDGLNAFPRRPLEWQIAGAFSSVLTARKSEH